MTQIFMLTDEQLDQVSGGQPRGYQYCQQGVVGGATNAGLYVESATCNEDFQYAMQAIAATTAIIKNLGK